MFLTLESSFATRELEDILSTKRAIFSRRSIIIPVATYDRQAIQASQKKMAEPLAKLEQEAVFLGETSGVSPRVSFVDQFFYRDIENPEIILPYIFAQAANVIVVPSNGRSYHPVIDQLFPLRPVSSLTVDEKKQYVDILKYLHFMSPSPKLVPPTQFARVVVPDLVKFIKNWINNIGSPISAIKHDAQPI